ncbi:hypothetical protein KOW79_018462 [Hemibagrus wyckioides]|uniref:Immunoglobulin domain-containing protein n=1 Tax=Hemibagrus wyckioides TaxID=337641 RepID=A0A9D3ND51_9TELE|nr:uncharacterized protein LOC131343524 isoform X4 [Hemibagrus wyckioides]KAG7318707.1 hypothetical protein KOW79_018462 [Hemibagrus wyckioides]
MEKAMQFCSLHHCVLVFLILTFTTAPVSALEVCPTRAKLHHPVTLSCKHQCSGLLQWSLRDYRDVVQARCDQTSCWSEKGFSISHDQYLKGDLSLTITAADYSQRNVYACECEDSDFSYVRLVIETVFSPVQMESGEDLKLHVSVPEPVEVIYKSSGSADEVICRVTGRSLQCKDKYRDRTSLTYPELTLRHMEPRDSGSYTIRDTKNEEDIQIYAVSVEAVFSQVQMKFGEDLKLHVSVPEPVEVIYKSSGSADEVICRVNNLSLQCKDKYRDRTSLTYPELTLRHMEPRDSGRYTIRDTKNEEDIQIYAVSVEDKQHAVPVWVIVLILIILLSCCVGVGIYLKRRHHLRILLNRRLQQVLQLAQQAEEGTEENITEAEQSFNQLEQHYNTTEYSEQISMLCTAKKKQLQQRRERLRRKELNRRLLHMVQLVQQAEEGKKENTGEVEKELNQLKNKYKDTEYSGKVSKFCTVQQSQLNWYRLQHSNEEPIMTKRRELKWRMLHVEQLVQQAKEGTEEKIREAEEAIDELEQEYEDMVYSDQVSVLCTVKREQLKGHQYSKEECLITEDLELKRRLQQVDQLVQQAEGEIHNIRKAEKEINLLELQYMNTEHLITVTEFCVLMRAELYWYRLQYSDGEHLMTDKTEILWKVEELMNSLQKLRDGAEQEQEIPSFKVMDEMQKHLMEFKKWCEEKRGEDK